ncbi:MAG: glycerophosphodiester phosphodiesterase [Dehalococcoidia bacterium]
MLRTLHAAGNYRALHPLAKHPAVDAIEADVWIAGDRVLAHHERPIGDLPLLLSNRGIRGPIPDPVELDELLAAVEGHCRLVLDVRSWFGDPAPDLARRLAPHVGRKDVSITCESWKVADRVRAWLPDVPVAYSVRQERQARRFVGLRLDGRIPPTPIAIRHTLLIDEMAVEALHEHTPHISAWTVDDVDRAIELASWGVDEVVSNRLQVLNSL